MVGNKKRKPSKKKKLSAAEKLHRAEIRSQRKEISDTLKNVGFERLPYIDGKHFVYNDRRTELDDIFICENIILLVEYTVGDPGDHLLKKSIFYNKVCDDKRGFLEFMLKEEKLISFKNFFESNIRGSFSMNELKLQILYCSKKTINYDYKKLVSNVVFFDYHVVKYFKHLTRVIRKSSKYEFLEFLRIPYNQYGQNIKLSSVRNANTFHGHILPEERSSFQEGFKIVTFYIDAESLLKRAFVLRQNGWREMANVGHYQRLFDSAKISSMRKYLAEKNRVFINNIISTISVEHIKLFDSNDNQLTVSESGQFVSANATEVTPARIEINDECNIVGLIDGQHRTFAYHEGVDQYEQKIAGLRKIQNLLVTGILFPKDIKPQTRLKFEANLFLEINSNQTNVRSQLKQEIELMISPFSSVAIGKRILFELNRSGPLGGLLEQYWYEKGKLKTASIVSFGLRPLIKLEDTKSNDSLFFAWTELDKYKLRVKDNEEEELLNTYVGYSVERIRDLLIAFKDNLDSDKWNTYSPSTPNGVLTVTFVNGVLNVIRLLIQHNKLSDVNTYRSKLSGINSYRFKSFKSSQYRKMGEDIFSKYFK